MPDAAAITPIHHDRAARRFVVVRDGHEAWLDYELAGRTLVITHTIVPAAIGGRGIASPLCLREPLGHPHHSGSTARVSGLFNS